MNGSVVSIQKAWKTYKQGLVEVQALQGIDLEIEKGSFTALAGPSGSGKTTLLNLIGGLDTPTSGTISVEGNDLSTLSRGKLSALRLNRIGFVFQAYNLIPVLTAYENAEFVMLLQGIPEEERRRRVYEMFELVGLKGLENRLPKELSGGQQQRVAVARAIVAEPAIILADEPTANLDSKSAQSLLTVMEALNKKKGATFIFSTHDPRVMRQAKTLIFLKDGTVERITKGEEFLEPN